MTASSWDAIVLGAGPSGSLAAYRLAQLGVRTLLVERAALPRDKLCGGWVTMAAFRAAGVDPATYPRTLQAFTGGVIYELGEDQPWKEMRGDAPVCYGIVRSEFDEYLARRAVAAGAVLRDSCNMKEIRVADPHGGPGGRSPLLELTFADGTTARAPMVLGGGGNFCPVARWIEASPPDELIVVCHEREIRVGEDGLRRATPYYGQPELFGMPDGRGYAWVVTKGPFLNIGIGLGRPAGSEDAGTDLKRAQDVFMAQLGRLGHLRDIQFPAFKGHAYKLWDSTPRRVISAGVVLIGDAAGLAANFTGEGIRPAIESGALAAEHVAAALREDDCSAERLAAYATALEERMGRRRRPMFSMTKLLHELAPSTPVEARP
jgi:menaquinone-9 beta-reductase